MRAGANEFGGYQLVRRIGVGGFSDIYLAQKFGGAGYERTVVLKKLRPDLAEDEGFVEQVLEECRILPLLRHENVVRTIEVGEERRTPFLAMEFLFGRTLEQVVERCESEGLPIPVEHVRTIIADVLEALEYVHHKVLDADNRPLTIVHRDVSPSNIMIGFDGLVRLIDFGVAKSDIQVSRTRVGMVKGRFGYMSPEQVRRDILDGRSDLFAVGCVLWEALFGGRLFERRNELDTMRAVLRERVRLPKRKMSKEQRRLARVAQRGLARPTWRRFRSASSMREAVLRGDLRPRDEARDELEVWLRGLFASELDRRDAALRVAQGNPTEFRMVRDSGLEMLPEITDPLGRSYSLVPERVPIAEREEAAEVSRSRWWLGPAALIALASVGLGAFVGRIRRESERTGWVYVAGDGECEISIGDRVLGRGPVQRLEVLSGVHELRCSRNGAVRRLRVAVREGQSRFVDLRGDAAEGENP